MIPLVFAQYSRTVRNVLFAFNRFFFSFLSSSLFPYSFLFSVELEDPSPSKPAYILLLYSSTSFPWHFLYQSLFILPSSISSWSSSSRSRSWSNHSPPHHPVLFRKTIRTKRSNLIQMMIHKEKRRGKLLAIHAAIMNRSNSVLIVSSHCLIISSMVN